MFRQWDVRPSLGKGRGRACLIGPCISSCFPRLRNLFLAFLEHRMVEKVQTLPSAKCNVAYCHGNTA